MRYKEYIMSFLLLLLPFAASAQTSTISGSVSYKLAGMNLDLPASGAVVKVVYEDNLSRLAKTGGDGTFRIKDIPTGEVTLSITPSASAGIKLKPFSETFKLLPADNVVIVTLEMDTEGDAIQVDGGTIDGAVVSGKAPTLTMRGDTLMYHTAGVKDKLNEGDYAIEALKNMPGVRVENGRLEVFGESVVRTYVNGALIFGLNALTPFENIKAEEMVSFDVYNEDEKTKVANMKTRNPIFSVADVKSSFAYGGDEQKTIDSKFQPRYLAFMDGNFYSEFLAMGARVSGTNVGVSPTGVGDIEYRAVRSDRKDLNVDVSLEKFWGHRLLGDALQVNYAYKTAENAYASRSRQDWFASGAFPARFVTDSSYNSSYSGTHHFGSSLSINSKGTEMTRTILQWRNDVNIFERNQDAFVKSSTAIDGMKPFGREETKLASDNDWSIEEYVKVSPVSGLSFTLEGKLQNRSGNSSLVDTIASVAAVPRFMVTELSGREKYLAATVEKRFGLYIYLKDKVSYRNVGQRQGATDFPGGSAESVNQANTYDYRFRYLSNVMSLNGYLSLFFGEKRLNVTPDFSIAVDKVMDDEYYPSKKNGDRVFVSFLPNLNFNFDNRINASISSSSILPEVHQLRSRINDADPMVLSAGNPLLGESQNYNIMLYYGGSSIYSNGIGKGGVSYSITARADMTTNPIIQKARFFKTETWLEEYAYNVPSGAVLQTWENANLATRTSLTGTIRSDMVGFPRADLRISLSYGENPRYNADKLDRIRDLSPSVSFISYHTFSPKLKYYFNSEVTYSKSSLKDGGFANEVLRGKTRLSITTIQLKNLYANVDYIWEPVKVLSGMGTSVDMHELNLHAGMNLFKQAVKLGVSGLNLLNSGSVYESVMTENSFNQSWKPSYGRTFLVTLSVRLNTPNPHNFIGAGSVLRF